MVDTVENWVRYLQQSGVLIGLPLLLGGVILALGGWRIRKAAVPASFGLIGILIGLLLGKGSGQDWLYAAVGFVVLGAVGCLLGDRTVALLGGLIGAGVFNYLAEGLGFSGAGLWAITAIGMMACAALSFINLRQVVIVVTSFEGAVLVVSASVAFFAGVPWIANRFRGTSWCWSLVVLFMLMVPTVIGAMMQMADAKQRDAGIVQS